MIGGMLIVGLYSAVEHFTKQILGHRYPPSEVNEFYKLEMLPEALARDCDMNLSALPEFAAIDELRQRNNAVKNGGQYREPSLAHCDRVRPTVVSYLKRIGALIVS